MGAGHSSWGLDDIHFDHTGDPMSQAIHIRPAHGPRDYVIKTDRPQRRHHYPNYDLQHYYHPPNHHNYHPPNQHNYHPHDHYHHAPHWSYHPHRDYHHHNHTHHHTHHDRHKHHYWGDYWHRGGKDYPSDNHPTCATNWPWWRKKHLFGRGGSDYDSPDREPLWRRKPWAIPRDRNYDWLGDLGDRRWGKIQKELFGNDQ